MAKLGSAVIGKKKLVVPSSPESSGTESDPNSGGTETTTAVHVKISSTLTIFTGENVVIGVNKPPADVIEVK